MADYVIGIDGGGTSCRAALADRQGRILGLGKSGSSNILTDPDNSIRHIVEAAELAYVDAGLKPDLPIATAALGLAGNNVGTAADYVSARLPFRKSTIVSDGLIALQGAIGDENGAIGIIGTGTIYIIRQAGQIRSIAGWGFQVSDLGSGARLGQSAIQECLLAHDAIHPMSGLSQTLLDEFRHNPEAIVEFARAATPADFGRYAPLVVDFAKQGDIAAVRIMDKAASEIDEALDAVEKVTQGQGRLCLLGGLATRYLPYLSDRHRARLSEPQGDALTGAVAFALSAAEEG